MFPEDTLESADQAGEVSRTGDERRLSGDRHLTAAPETEEHVKEFLEGRLEAVRTVSDWVRSVVVHRAWGFRDVDDIVQATLLALVQNLREGRFKAGDFRAYARRIAKNKCVNNYRRLRARGHHVSLEAGGGLSKNRYSGEETERHTILGRILERLNEGCRQIVLLAYVQGYSREEISSLLGVSEEAVRVRLYRCIRSARAVMKSLGDIDMRRA